MAQSWRSRPGREQARRLPPLDEAALERIALRYVERYATTRAKLAAYLARKVSERGWAGEDAPGVSALVEKLSGLGYVDDQAFAAARASSLTRRGYGLRRVAATLKAAGIEEEDVAEAEEAARQSAWEAALVFARRKKIGPFALQRADRIGREKAFAALLRAGHDVSISRKLVDAEPGHVPELD